MPINDIGTHAALQAVSIEANGSSLFRSKGTKGHIPFQLLYALVAVANTFSYCIYYRTAPGTGE